MAFTCNLTDGYVLGCSSIGGVEKVWIGEWEDIVGYTTSASNLCVNSKTAFNASNGFSPATLPRSLVINKSPCLNRVPDWPKSTAST